MITGELKNKIDGLWEIFWTGGLTNPLDVIEQMTYLMFIHDLDATDNTRAMESAMLGIPYVNRITKGREQIVNKTFVKMMDELGYDVELTYKKKAAD